MVHPVTYGKRVRMSYSRIEEVLDLPDLTEVQKVSYKWFLKEGLKEAFDDISPIEDYTGNIILEFLDYYIEDEPKYTERVKQEKVIQIIQLGLRLKLDLSIRRLVR